MKALVLAGGFPQIALIRELKRRNITTLLADYYPNPVAKPYADAFFQISTLDVPAITDLARREQVDFLITACTDQALLTVAQVSEELVLGGEIAAAICAFVYKQFMPVLIYAASVLVLVGLLAMYLCGEVALSAKTEKKK